MKYFIIITEEIRWYVSHHCNAAALLHAKVFSEQVFLHGAILPGFQRILGKWQTWDRIKLPASKKKDEREPKICISQSILPMKTANFNKRTAFPPNFVKQDFGSLWAFFISSTTIIHISFINIFAMPKRKM
jgi:hypothetical protein